MIFDDLPVGQAERAILAHSVRQGSVTLKKGHVLTAEDVAALRQAGRQSVVAARLEEGDVHEDEAAARLAVALADDTLVAGDARTGRVNLHAKEAGVAVIDGERLNRINGIDEAVTVATLPAMA